MSARFTNILLPTDFSDASRPALAHARDLPDAFDAQVHCLPVVDNAYQYWSAIGPASLPIGPSPEDFVPATEHHAHGPAADLAFQNNGSQPARDRPLHE